MGAPWDSLSPTRSGYVLLSDPDYDVLSTLSEAEGDRWRVTEFARRLLWDQSRLSHQLSRMEKRGLVAREDCTSDGRGAFVVLTDAGRRALEAAAPNHAASVREHFVDLLTPDQLATLDAIAQTVIDHLGQEGSMTGNADRQTNVRGL